MPTLLAYGAALMLTLCACAWLTPRAWWRRPNARALGLLGAGTLGGGAVLLALAGVGGPPVALAAEDADATPGDAVAAAAELPRPGAGYRAHDALNLRVGSGVGAARLLVVPAGSRVVATGRAEGDWWQVRARLDGRDVEGWASSLWLRRADEGRP